MFSCAAWIAGFLSVWLLILAWHFQSGVPLAASANAMAYALLAIVAAAATGRCAPKWHPALKRRSSLFACTILAVVDVGLAGLAGETAQEAFFAALLGIALVVLAARHAPASLRRIWLGEGGA